MKKKLLISLLLITLFIPFVNVKADTHNSYTIKTNSFTTADTSRNYNITSTKQHNFTNFMFHEIQITRNGVDVYFLAHCLDEGKTAPRSNGGILPSPIEDPELIAPNDNVRRMLSNVLSVSIQTDGTSVGDFVNKADNTTKKGFLAAQIIIWEIMEGVRVDYSTNVNAPYPNTYDFVTTDSELKSLYEDILRRASALDYIPTTLEKTYIMHWNDGQNKYTVSNIDVGEFRPDTYDTNKLNITNNNGNLTITSNDSISNEEQINLVRIAGSTYDPVSAEGPDNYNRFYMFLFDDPTGKQRLLLAHFRRKDTSNIKVKSESGTFKLIKKDTTTNKTLKGAVFKLYKCSSQTNCESKETQTIDMKNKDISSDITIKKSGLYLFKETTVPFGYEKVEDFYVTFNIDDEGKVTALVDAAAKNVSKKTEDGKISIIIGNEAKYFNIKKIDGRDNKVQIKGAGFKIKKSDGTIMKFSQISEGKYSYDQNGSITTLKSNNNSVYQISLLPVGEYILEEISIPYPYVMPTKQLEKETKFRIDNTDYLQVYNASTNKYIKSSDVTVTVKNFKTRVTIIKTGLKSALIPGVVFELYDKNKQNQVPVRYENGEYIYNENETPIQLVTDSKGQIVINYLKEGTYYLKEVMTPPDSGLVIDPNNQYTKIDIYVNRNDATPYNYRKEVRNGKGSFCFYKIDEDGNYLASGKFKLQMYNEKQSKYEDKALILNQDNTYSIDETLKSDIYIFTPTDKGQTCFTDINAKGKYRIVEIEAPEGFVLPNASETQAELVINEYGYAVGDAVIINKKVKIGEGAEAQAELIISIQTGQNRMHYIAVIVTILLIISGLIYYKKKIDKK